MNRRNDDRAAEMRAVFFESATDLLQALNDDALRLETNPSDAETVRSIRRSVHSLKGDSAIMGFSELSDLAHELEDVLAPETALANAASLAEVVLSAADMFDAMLAAYRGNLEPPNGDPLRAMIWKLANRSAPVAPAPPISADFSWSEYDQTVIEHAEAAGRAVFNVALAFSPDCPMREAASAMIRKVLEEIGELLAAQPDPSQWPSAQIIVVALASERSQGELAAKLHIPGIVGRLLIRQLSSHNAALNVESEPAAAAPKTHSTGDNLLRVDSARVDTVLNLIGELVIGKSMLQQAITEFTRKHPKDPVRTKLLDALAFQSQVLNGLQRAATQIRMVPVEQLFRRFPRLVRDVARFCGKHVEFETSGQETALDKALIDALAEPLAHIVRNAIDHGIETPAERRAAGKPEQGTLRMNAYHQANQVVIEVSDDGHGVDTAAVLQRAVDRGLIAADKAQHLEAQEILDFIFEPGFTTAADVTAISGRGVGMDVVKAAVQKLKGTISIDTAPGRGTTLQIKLPLTLAILRAMLFRVSERLYAVPLDSVSEIRRAHESEIVRAGNREVLQVRDEMLTIVRLRRMDMPKVTPARETLFILVIDVGARKFGLVVDSLVGEQELVIKPLDEHVVASDVVSGASVLGDGTVALILNVSEVIRRYANAAPILAAPTDTKSWGATA